MTETEDVTESLTFQRRGDKYLDVVVDVAQFQTIGPLDKRSASYDRLMCYVFPSSFALRLCV